ncbi:hypothetical protein EYB25_005661 [Talaromyces marneffei]|nr:hypothetical protein EYB25_005661 [Talaromyces marneffei]
MFTPGELLEKQFLADAPPRFPDVYMQFDVDFLKEENQYLYKVTIKLHHCEMQDTVHWVKPEPPVRVIYYTDEESTRTVKEFRLKFDDKRVTASFYDSLTDREWKRFILIGMEFDEMRINYTLDFIDNDTQTALGDEMAIEEMRKVSLLSYKKYKEGHEQIWGTRYSGLKESLGIVGGHSLAPELD